MNYADSMNQSPCFILNRGEWNVVGWWTQEQLDNADQEGFIGMHYGVACYLVMKINFVN